MEWHKNKWMHKSKALAKSVPSSPPAERVAMSEGAGNKKSALFLQHPDDIFVSILLKN